MLAAAALLRSWAPAAAFSGDWYAGMTSPAEITALAASSTDIDSSMISDFGRYIRKPVGGVGLHGMNPGTAESSPPLSLLLISLSFSLAMKTIDQTPLRGYST